MPATRSGPSWASSDATLKSMKGNRIRDTGPEMAVRLAVHQLGLRYRVNARPEPTLRRTADLVFRPAKVAVFIDGCFWHCCPIHGTRPKANSDYWSKKLDKNIQRDSETTRALEESGWKVPRFWEHESPVEVADRIRTVVMLHR